VIIQPPGFEILSQIPDGPFRKLVAQDLDRAELFFYEVMERYFTTFLGVFFEEDSMFWTVFVNTFATALGCQRDTISRAIDELACQILYKFPNPSHPRLFVALNRFSFSERAGLEIASQTFPKLDRASSRPTLTMKNGKPCCSAPLADGGLICEIPGKVYNYEELPASGGLDQRWISIPNTDFVITTEETSFTIGQDIRRSFHFNCEPKLVRIQGEVKVALIAHRMRGPLIDRIVKKGPAIPEGTELVLPLDADLPFPAPVTEWKDKRAKFRPSPPVEPRQSDRPKGNSGPAHALLALFYDPSSPPLPFKVLSAEEITEKEKVEAIKSSSRIMTRNSLRKSGEDKG
jgi:hypothetical protein